jgi:predicted AAA+ superfamily ATPase
LCAGRTGHELNLAALGRDAGVSQPTARAWLSVLEATYVCFRLPAWHRNMNKRLVRAPKLHFVDTGLACHLLGIRTPQQLSLHPLRGALFETWVASEVLKARSNLGAPSTMFHFRDTKGVEIDVVVERGDDIVAVEAKSGTTVASDFFKHLDRFTDLVGESTEHRPVTRVLIHGGTDAGTRTGTRVTPWNRVHTMDWDG